MFGATCGLLLAMVAAQEVPQLQQQLVSERLSLEQADKAATFWQSQTQTQTAELHDALSHEKASALGSASLTACLRTRDVVQMEMQKLQEKQDDLSHKFNTEKQLAAKVVQTTHSGLSECEARLKVTVANNTATVHNLQDLQGKVKKEHDDLKESASAAQAEQVSLQSQVAEKEKAFQKQIADAKLDQERKVANLKKQHAKVMEAHNMLKKAHQALQKQHDQMQKDEEEQKTQRSQQASQQVTLQENLKECQTNLKNSTESSNNMRTSEKDVHQAAHSAGAEQSGQKWNEILKNITTQNAALEAQVEALEKSAVEQEKKAKDVEKDIPEMQTKLRQCRASREKTELETQKALQHCPKKEAFLQMQIEQWP